MAASARRFYEQRGLLAPAARRGGRHWYGRQELRRIAFIRAAQHVGLALEDIEALLASDGDDWRPRVLAHIAALQRKRAWIDAATSALEQVLACPGDHWPTECPYMVAALDAWIDSDLWRNTGDTDREQDVTRMLAELGRDP